MTQGTFFFDVFQVTNLPLQFWALVQLLLSALLSAVQAGLSKKPLLEPVMVRISSKDSSVSHMTRPRFRFSHIVMALDHFPWCDFETLYSLIEKTKCKTFLCYLLAPFSFSSVNVIERAKTVCVPGTTCHRIILLIIIGFLWTFYTFSSRCWNCKNFNYLYCHSCSVFDHSLSLTR